MFRHPPDKAADHRYFAGFFTTEENILHATSEARDRGFEIHDVFTPYPVHGLDEAMALKRSNLTWVGFSAGLFGLVFALALQIWTSAYDWPLNVGGKPFNSFPVFIPVAFELTVLFSGLISVGALFMKNRMYPTMKRVVLPGVTDDRFVLVLSERDASFDYEEARRLFERHGAVDMLEGEGLV